MGGKQLSLLWGVERRCLFHGQSHLFLHVVFGAFLTLVVIWISCALKTGDCVTVVLVSLHKGPRPAVIVRFAFPRQRELVWNKHPLLKSTQFFISEDFPAEIENKRKFMYPIVAKSKHIPEYRGKVTMKMDKLYFKGREYCVKNLDSLPTQINPVTISQLENNNSICIGGVSSCFNGLSNFYSRDFTFDATVINGVAQMVWHKCV